MDKEIKEKYYTPKDLSEFKLNQEIELNSPTFNGDEVECNWYVTFVSPPVTEELVNWYYEAETYKDINLSKRVRVKYLDQEDIESLGWKRDPSRERYWEIGEIQLYYQPENNYLYIIDYPDHYLFRGKIKNKSELKKLMQMLEI